MKIKMIPRKFGLIGELDGFSRGFVLFRSLKLHGYCMVVALSRESARPDCLQFFQSEKYTLFFLSASSPCGAPV